MKPVIKSIAWMALSILCVVFPVSAKKLPAPFDISKVKIKIDNVDSMEVADFSGDKSQDILLLGRDNDKGKQLQLITLNEGLSGETTAEIVKLDSQILFYDTGRLAGSDKESLIFVLPGKVVSFDMTNNTLSTLIQTDSIYRSSRQSTTGINSMTFLHDVNNDGLSDILLPDFTHTNIFIQQPQGGFAKPQIIELQAQMEVFSDNRVVFSGVKLYPGDYNFDGAMDLLYRIGSQLHIYPQLNGQFSAQPLILPLNLALPLSDEFDDFSKDQSALVTHQFVKLVDLNNDKILDLITKVTKSSGIFDKTSKYQFYFGHQQIGSNCASTIAYNSEPNSVVSSKGMQFELTLVDIDGDKQLDLVSPSFELGIGTIIASLFSSSADLDIRFHPLTNSEGYELKPNLEKELSVDFDLSSGQRVYPLLKVSDFDGDGVNDLLIGHGSQRIYLYPGTKNNKLFVRKPQKFKIKLPRNGQFIAANDLNNDGRTDLIIRYDKLDGEALHNEVRILLAK
jgi:hypothetical protein